VGQEPLLPYLVLLRAGFTVPRAVTSRAVRSYRTFSPLPTEAGGIFSVALSMGSRPPGVTWRPVRRSPDFPLYCYSDCLANSGSLGSGFYSNYWVNRGRTEVSG